MSWVLDREPEIFNRYSRLDPAWDWCLKQAINLIWGCSVLCLTVLKRSKFVTCFCHLTLCPISHQHYSQPQKNRRYNGLDLQLPFSPQHSFSMTQFSCSQVWDHPVCTFTKPHGQKNFLIHAGDGTLVLELNCARCVSYTKACHSLRDKSPKKPQMLWMNVHYHLPCLRWNSQLGSDWCTQRTMGK